MKKRKPKRTRIKPTKVKGGSRLPIGYHDPFMTYEETKKAGKRT